MKKVVFLSVLMVAGLVSCNDMRKPDTVKTKAELDYEKAWVETIGNVDPEQTWQSTSPVSIDVKDAGDAVISIYSLGEAQRILLARETVSSDATIEFDMPAGLDYGVAVCRETAEGSEYIPVGKSSLSGGSASVSFASMATKADFSPISSKNKKARTKQTRVDPRTGRNAKIWGYTNFPSWIWADMNDAIPEDNSAVVSNQITNFDLQSNGLFYIAAIYGSTGNANAEIGYYYYDKANPSSVTYIPLIDALGADYYYDGETCTAENALPKVMWADKSWNWAPANFCFYDTVDGMTSSSSAFQSRKGDNEFNTLSIQKKYGSRDPEQCGSSMIKGLTFQIDAPKGNMVGFYCKRPDGKVNHTTASLNASGKPRAAIKVYDGFRFIGLEDGVNDSSKEPDCNDIAFVMVPGNDGILPGLYYPYIKDNDSDKFYNGDGTLTEEPKYDVTTDGPDAVYEDLASRSQVWTVVFEDMGTIGDFDFNDVVIAIVPNKSPKGKKSKNRTAEVYLCATGGTLKANLYYKDHLIGEVHELLGSVENGKNVIANTYEQRFAMKHIHTIDWNPGHQMDEAMNFKLVVGNNVITLSEKKGEIPKALCIPGTGNDGLWAWPKESIRIDQAYPGFADWAYDGKNSNHGGWYKKPEKDKTVRF